jgi:hypothetical protein
MTITAELADGRVLEFPDGTDTAVIQSTVKRMVKPDKPGFLSSVLEGASSFRPSGALMGAASAGLKSLGDVIGTAGYKAGEKTSEALHSVGLPPEVAGGVGTVVNAGVQAVPMLLGGNAARAATPLMEHGAKQLMQSALKPTLRQLRTGESAKAIDTLLSEGINVTPGGVMKLKSRIADLNRQITGAISSSSGTVNKQQVANELQGTLDRFSKQVTPGADLKAVQGAWDEFMNHPLLQNVDEIPVQLAQQLKTGTYRQLKDKYGQLGTADVEAQKSLARGLKEGVANAVPDIASLNARESQLLNALNVTERRVLMDANKNPGGLAWIADHPIAAVLFMADRSPMLKSLLARALHSGSEKLPVNAARLGILGAQNTE